MTTLDNNLQILRQRYPELAAKLAASPDAARVCVFSAKDGGLAYGLRESAGITPITDPVSPLSRMQSQLQQQAASLTDFGRPVLIIGLYPGTELAYIFNLSEKETLPHPRQDIYVCIDSLPCLQAFLSTVDARAILNSPRVTFFWHGDAAKVTNHILAHPELPHNFIPISGAGNSTVQAVIPAFTKLVASREAEWRRLSAENNAYYDAMTDEELASIIGSGTGEGAGEVTTKEQNTPSGEDSAQTVPLATATLPGEAGSSNSAGLNQPKVRSNSDISVASDPKARFTHRAPRLMLPTSAWSTVTQYSARDTAAAFESIGWEVKVLNMETAMTPYYIAKQINEFKPDVFLFINHLRTEALEAYPRNMMFITWVQDAISHINRKKAAAEWNKLAS